MFVLSGRRAYAPAMPEKLPCRRGERKPVETRSTCKKAIDRFRPTRLQIAPVDKYAGNWFRELVIYVATPFDAKRQSLIYLTFVAILGHE
jgi:hypothetical protein